MNLEDFRRVVVAFADDARDLDLSKGRLVAHIRDEIIDVKVIEDAGDLFVLENEERVRAFDWVVTRLARLPMLADRIASNIPNPKNFVSPAGRLLDPLNVRPDGEERRVDGLPEEVLGVLSRGTPGTSTVLYVTSDAGEGKTTLINHLAHLQAEKVRAKQDRWLLVPISLSGRSFLTFDDVVVAELMNKLRFQLLYYQAFVELVRMRVIVPAFDGFEEMFIQGSSGEALSALGNLMHDLESSGSVLIAAREAYFEYQNFGMQAKLFDAIGSNAVDFARIALDRWDRSRFEEYAKMRGLADAATVYSKTCERLGNSHPLLTRAVLVERLVEVALQEGVDGLLNNLGSAPEDYFFQFVNRLIEREALEKWIDRSGTPQIPLLSTEEHHSLLAYVAKEMWISGTEVLRGDHMDLLAELYASDRGKPPHLARQIVNRLKQHSMIVADRGASSTYAFDHEDFRGFYLGQALGDTLLEGHEPDVTAFLSRASIQGATAEAALNAVKRKGGNLTRVNELLLTISRSARDASYTAENVATIVIRLLERLDDGGDAVIVEKVYFPQDALKSRRLGRVSFRNCHFHSTSLDGARLGNTEFIGCNFEMLEWSEPHLGNGTKLQSCSVRSVRAAGGDGEFAPGAVDRLLVEAGFTLLSDSSGPAPAVNEIEPDEDVILAEHALRIFMRATQINEDVFRQRLGTRATRFFDDVLPEMLKAGIFEETRYKGSGRQLRFKLCVPMRNIDAAVPASVGSLPEFLAAVVRGS